MIPVIRSLLRDDLKAVKDLAKHIWEDNEPDFIRVYRYLP